MDWLLHRNFWIVRLLGAAMVTALLADTMSTASGRYLMNSATSARTTSSEPDQEEDADANADANADASGGTTPAASWRTGDRARRAEYSATRILGHNLFCPTCAPEPPTEDASPSRVASGDPDTLSGAQRSALPFVVAATMEAEDPEHSIATLVDVQQGTGGLFGVGDRLGANVEVVQVTTGVVHIRNAGRLEYIPFEGAMAAPPVPPASAKHPGARIPKQASIAGAQEAITCNAEGDCVVDRAFVEQLIANPGILVGQGRASPATTKSGAPGFRLRAVRKGSVPDLLGLRNGDVVTEVGGSPLTLDALPGLFGKLRHASNIDVRIDRRGKALARNLEIRS